MGSSLSAEGYPECPDHSAPSKFFFLPGQLHGQLRLHGAALCGTDLNLKLGCSCKILSSSVRYICISTINNARAQFGPMHAQKHALLAAGAWSSNTNTRAPRHALSALCGSSVFMSLC